jgi:two-component system response regulator LytT
MHILIIEDEARIAKRVERITRQFFGNTLEQLMLCDSLPDGQELMDKHTFDLVLLDLNLNGADGFEILKRAASESFHTIIISAYKEKALTAFEYGVLDFVPKPFDQERLAKAFLRLSLKEKEGLRGVKFLGVKKRGNISLVDVNELLYVKGAGIYSELHLKNGRTELHEKSLEKLEKLLPGQFKRIHKSYLVDLNESREILVQSGGRYNLLLKNKEVLPIGRTRYKELKEELTGNL